MFSITITHSADAGQRIDRFVRKYLGDAPLGVIFKMLRTGKIKVNKKKQDGTYRLEQGDEVTFWLSDEQLLSMKPKEKDASPTIISQQKSALDAKHILYEDDVLMVINKPPGMNVHAGDHKTQESNLIDQVHDYLGSKYNSLTFRPALVHRIDRDTSGCILIAKEKDTLEFLLSELQKHNIEKVYHALVLGIPVKEKDTIRLKLLRIQNAKNEAKVRVDIAGQSAITHYELMASYVYAEHTLCLLECRIETGRTHQIRVHLAAIGSPILGDALYGNKKINSYFSRNYPIKRQLLHARMLSFFHPKLQKYMTITAPYFDDFLEIISEK